MTKAEIVLTAWDKTLETRDFSHLSVFLSDDFQFEDTTGEVEDLATTKSWCILGEIRIKNFKIIRKMKIILWQRMMSFKMENPAQTLWFTLKKRTENSFTGKFNAPLKCDVKGIFDVRL